jgi:hypothetical protein
MPRRRCGLYSTTLASDDSLTLHHSLANRCSSLPALTYGTTGAFDGCSWAAVIHNSLVQTAVPSPTLKPSWTWERAKSGCEA